MISQNYVQVEIPKVPRWLGDILTDCQTRDYKQFKGNVIEILKKFADDEHDINRLASKELDLAIALGVWEVENEQRY